LRNDLSTQYLRQFYAAIYKLQVYTDAALKKACKPQNDQATRKHGTPRADQHQFFFPKKQLLDLENGGISTPPSIILPAILQQYNLAIYQREVVCIIRFILSDWLVDSR
jgi:hypothetical protein